MENNSTSYVVAGVVVVALLLIGYGMYSRSDATPAVLPVATSTPAEVLPLTINVKHYFENGTHWYRGVVTTPTPCYDVSATATSEANGDELIAITSRDRGGVCAQLMTDKEFSVEFAGNPNAVRATLNGKPAELNIVEVTSKKDLLGPFDFKA